MSKLQIFGHPVEQSGVTTGSVTVNGDWSNAAQALADIQASTNLEFTLVDMFVFLWEGPTDPDDYAVLHAAGVGAPEWLSHTGQPSAFASAPVNGDAYISAVIYQP